MRVECIKEDIHNFFKKGEVYNVIDADMYGYLIKAKDKEIWISKNDIKHFKYNV